MVNFTVFVRPGTDPDALVRIFKKASQKSGLSTDMSRRRHFVPKAQKRKAKSHAAQVRANKHARR